MSKRITGVVVIGAGVAVVAVLALRELVVGGAR